MCQFERATLSPACQLAADANSLGRVSHHHAGGRLIASGSRTRIMTSPTRRTLRSKIDGSRCHALKSKPLCQLANWPINLLFSVAWTSQLTLSLSLRGRHRSCQHQLTTWRLLSRIGIYPIHHQAAKSLCVAPTPKYIGIEQQGIKTSNARSPARKLARRRVMQSTGIK